LLDGVAAAELDGWPPESADELLDAPPPDESMDELDRVSPGLSSLALSEEQENVNAMARARPAMTDKTLTVFIHTSDY
jgi:hypothetical protein